MKKHLITLLGIVLGLALLYAIQPKPEVIVAVIDTGVAFDHPNVLYGKNFWGDVKEVKNDPQNHGTRVAKIILEECPDCKILPLKVSESGRGITPGRLYSAVYYANKQSAKVINISAGLLKDSPRLRNFIPRLGSVTIVTAAGGGIRNPFRFEDLKNVYPQSYPEVLVAAGSGESNLGKELDFVFESEKESSMAAARISGIVGQYLSRWPTFLGRPTSAELRAMLRASTEPEKDFKKKSWGSVNRERFLESKSIEIDHRFFEDRFEVNSSKPVADVQMFNDCSATLSKHPLSFPEKGSLRFRIDSSGDRPCKLNVTVKFEDGSDHKFSTQIPPRKAS